MVESECTGKMEMLGEKPAPFYVYPVGSDLPAITALRNQRPVTSHLSHDTIIVLAAAVLSKTLVYYYHIHHAPEISNHFKEH
jgi:hypothetical protein